jgi:hypothetical protein
MVFAIITEPFPYVLESDRTLPENLQTKFWIKAHTAEMTDRITVMFANARKPRARGDQYDPAKWSQATVDAFVMTVTKVENYIIPAAVENEFTRVLIPDGSTPALEYRGTQCHVVPMVDTRPKLTAVAQLMSGGQLTEISERADQVSHLSDAEKKSSNI